MTRNLDELKRQAAEQAAALVQSGMVVGLGTGSTAVHMVRAIGRMLADGRLRDVVGIPTSEATAQEAMRCGIPLTTFDQHPTIDITIDGADEIAPNLDLIKGLGGALLREKIVAAVSRQMVVVADHTKQVAKLGARSPVPVEVIPFAQRPVQTYLELLGARVVLRQKEGQVFQTDEGNVILDCHFAGIDDPAGLGRAIRQQPGVVEHGLFLGMASRAFVATESGVVVLE